MMYFTDHRAAKQTRLGLGTVQNQIHPKSLGWPSGSHNHKVNLPRPLEKFTRGIYNLASLRPLLSRLTLETESLKALYLALFLCQRESYPRRYSVNIASEFTVTEHPVLNLYFDKRYFSWPKWMFYSIQKSVMNMPEIEIFLAHI